MTNTLNNYLELDSITDTKLFVQKLLWQLCKDTEAGQGAFYIINENTLKYVEGYAFPYSADEDNNIEIGEGLTGQVAKDGKFINVTDVPEGYLTIISGLGKSSPTSLLIYPFKRNLQCVAVLEISGFKTFEQSTIEILEQLNDLVIKKI